MRSILPAAPLDLVYLFLYLQGFEVVEFRFVRLELRMKFVFACLFLLDVSVDAFKLATLVGFPKATGQSSSTYGLISFEQYHSPTLVSRRKVVASMIELNSRYYVRYGQDVSNVYDGKNS